MSETGSGGTCATKAFALCLKAGFAEQPVHARRTDCKELVAHARLQRAMDLLIEGQSQRQGTLQPLGTKLLAQKPDVLEWGQNINIIMAFGAGPFETQAGLAGEQ